MNFKKFTEEVFSLYTQGKYNQALDIVQKAKNEYPEKLHKTSYWAACLYTKLDKHREAINVLRRSVEKGFWWSPKLLTEDSDLEPLGSEKEFIDLVSKCNELREERQLHSEAKVNIITPENYKKNKEYPLLIILHSRNGNAQDFSNCWDISYLKKNFIMAFPQSSQVFGMDSYCWDELTLAKKEVKEHYKKITQNYKIDIDNVIIAGASQGGRLAILLALEEKKFSGFIGIMPAITDTESFMKLLDNWEKDKMKGAIIVGTKDWFYHQVKTFYEKLIEFDYPIKLIIENGQGHFISSKFPAQILSAINYITKE